MLESLKNKMVVRLSGFTSVEMAAGVEVVFLGEEKISYNLVLLSLKKGLLTIHDVKEKIDSLEQLREAVPTGVPVSLVINGRGIMHRKFSTEDSSEEKVLQTMLPNAKPADFYFQVLENGSQSFASIARKSVADALLNHFRAAQLQVICCSLGPFSATCLLPMLSNINGFLALGGFHLTIKENDITDFSSTAENTGSVLEIGNERVNSALALAYAAAFQVLVPGVNPVSALINYVDAERSEFKNARTFKLMGWGILIFCLGILLINFICFTYLSEKNNLLLSKQASYQGMTSVLASLEKDVGEKEDFLRNAGWLLPSRTTLLSDRIGASVPVSVKLTALTIYPMDEKQSRTLKKEVFNTSIVKIEGACSRPTDLNPWLSRMDVLPGISDANVTSYLYDTKERHGNFIITLHLR